MALPLIMSGSPLPVLVDPDDQNRVLLELESPPAESPAPQGPIAPLPSHGTPNVSMIGETPVTTVLVESPDPSLSAQQVLERGLDGEATIVSTFDLGASVHTPDGMPARGFELDVRLSDGRPPYRVRIGAPVPPRLPTPPAPGMTVDVEVDPSDPTRVAIVWDLSSPGVSFGVEARTLPPDRGALLGVGGGVEVGTITPGTPAARSRLRGGDVIVGIDGQPVSTLDQLLGVLATRSPGDTVELTVRRERRDVPIPVTLSARTG